MSTTHAIDAKASLSGWMQGLISMYVADIKAIPDDKWTATFGGCTRPANEITADALGLVKFCTAALTGSNEVGGDYADAMKTLSQSMTNKETAVSTFTETCQAFCQALSSASDETLTREIMPPWQMPTTVYGLCQIAVSHIWYHDGQLNYIQCLLGDEKVHWMGD